MRKTQQHDSIMAIFHESANQWILETLNEYKREIAVVTKVGLLIFKTSARKCLPVLHQIKKMYLGAAPSLPSFWQWGWTNPQRNALRQANAWPAVRPSLATLDLAEPVKIVCEWRRCADLDGLECNSDPSICIASKIR